MAKTVHRTARIRVRATRGQRRRLFGLLVSAGDVWAWVIECNKALRTWGLPQVVDFPSLCRELTGIVFGELPRQGAEDILKRYSCAFREAAKRKNKGKRAGFPRRKRRLVPVRFRKGLFSIEGRRDRLATARGTPSLFLRLAREVPYPLESLRSLTLVFEAGRLYLDATAEIGVADNRLDPSRLAGVDPGIIHPLAVATEDRALLISGRALRAEERLHLEDTKARAKKMGRKAPKKGQRGSRRWRKYRASQRKAEARHRRKVRQAHHEAAKQVVSWLVDKGVGTLVVGHPQGITLKDSGSAQNLRLRQWRRTHLLSCLKDKAELAGMEVHLIDERGTSSTCPECRSSVSKPKGRNLSCASCGFEGHRDISVARNIAAKGGGVTGRVLLVEHRRAGRPPARRDRRRHLFDVRRSCPAPGPPVKDRESLVQEMSRGSFGFSGDGSRLEISTGRGPHNR